MADQPTGTVTLLFSDGCWSRLDRRGTRTALELHRCALREAFEQHGGY